MICGPGETAEVMPPLGDRVDVYMENIIKNRTVPCFVSQATALISGIGLILLRELDWAY